MSDATVSEPPKLFHRIAKAVEHPAVKIAVPLIVVALAVVVLHKLASHVKWSDVKADLLNSPPSILITALGTTCISFVGIALYDYVASRAVSGTRLPWFVPIFTGAAGFAVSGMLGVSYLTGSAVRYRIYSAFGLDLAAITGIIALAWAGFVLGLALIYGGLLTFHPDGLSSVLPLSPVLETAIGLAILGTLALFYIWLATGERHISAGGYKLALPRPRYALGLTGAGVIDLTGAALTLYVLMPQDVVQNFPYFATIYFAAVFLGICSHAPGGLGVFEATIIAAFGGSGRADVLAALVLYRVIYTITPFLVATICLGVAVSVQHRSKLGAASELFRRGIAPVVPAIAAGTALLAGIVLVISGNLPAEGEKLGVLRDIFPLYFVEASHLAGSIAGVLLIIIASGLYRRLYKAWLLTMILMAVGLVASLFKGLDFIESFSMLTTLAVLWLFRGSFNRAEPASLFRLDIGWLVKVICLMVAIFWVGLFAYDHVPYRNELWWQFSWNGDAPRFLRASLVTAIILIIVTFYSLINGRRKILSPEPIPDNVRELLRESDDAEANMALTGDKLFLFSEDGEAFVAFADTGRTLIAKGDPVGVTQSAQQAIWKLREQAYSHGKNVAFYSVSPKYLPTYLDMGLSILKIGEVARVDLQKFTLDGSGRKGLRQARNRAARDGYTFDIIPAAEIEGALPELRKVSDDWLERKQGQEKAFALGAFTDDYMRNFDTAVLRDPNGAIVAFANLFQAAKLHEISLDLMRYLPDGPGFAMDALFAEMLMWSKEQGYHWFSLGPAPFSGIDNRHLAPAWNRVGGFIYDHGDRFYHFEGLRAFKEKFDPVWTPNYLACPGGLTTPQILYEVNVLISGGIRGLLK